MHLKILEISRNSSLYDLVTYIKFVVRLSCAIPISGKAVVDGHCTTLLWIAKSFDVNTTNLKLIKATFEMNAQSKIVNNFFMLNHFLHGS